MGDQMYGRLALECYLREERLMNNLQKIQRKVEGCFFRPHFLEFKEMSDCPGLKSLIQDHEVHATLNEALNLDRAYYTFDSDHWERFGRFLVEEDGSLRLYCQMWFPWALRTYKKCVDCQDIIQECRPIIRYKYFRDEIKARFRGTIQCLAFNTHFPGTYSGFCDRSADIDELNNLWRFVKRGGANIYDLPQVEVQYSTNECVLCRRMNTQWRGERVNCRSGWYAQKKVQKKKRKRSST